MKNLVPNFIIDTFYLRIKERINAGLPYELYTRNLIKLNGKLPDKIEQLINEQTKEIKSV